MMKFDGNDLWFKGKCGLEKENLRITADGFFSPTPHPQELNTSFITRDFCENQIEINTPVSDSVIEAYDAMGRIDKKVKEILLPRGEYIWPFSNPPYIDDEDKIDIADFKGKERGKTEYRKYLAHKYGKRFMTFCGIHFNYSFTEELLKEIYKKLSPTIKPDTFRHFKDNFYLDLSRKVSIYGWIMTFLTAASPIIDSSFVEPGIYDRSIFLGVASVRTSRFGYWNLFSPTLDYGSMDAYTGSIQRYVDDGRLKSASELYYPVRIKPSGPYDLTALREKGADHIELRMIDLNPFSPCGLEIMDIEFAELFLIYLSHIYGGYFTRNDQIQATENFKRAASYNPNNNYVIIPCGGRKSIRDAASDLLYSMSDFYSDASGHVKDILDFQKEKLNPEKRYANKIRQEYSQSYVKKVLASLKTQS